MGGWGSRTHRPLGCKHDKRPGRILMILSVVFLGEGEVYLQGEPILLQEWPEGDFEHDGGRSRKYHRLLTLATSSGQSGTKNN